MQKEELGAPWKEEAPRAQCGMTPWGLYSFHNSSHFSDRRSLGRVPGLLQACSCQGTVGRGRVALFHLLTHILIQQCGGDVCIFTQQTSVMGGCSPVRMLDVPGEEAGWA